MSKRKELIGELDGKSNFIPTGWEEVKINDVFDFIGGGTPSKQNSDYWNGNLNWASVKDVKGAYLDKTEEKITELGLRNSATNIAFPNDVILITRINPGRTITSKIKTAINQDLKIVKPRFLTNPDFVRYLFSSIERECIKLASGTTVLGITLNNLNEIKILLPPLAEQQRIVARIEELFSSLAAGVESLKKVQAQLKTYRQAVLKWAFEGRLTNPDVKDGELPDGWRWEKLGDISTVYIGSTPKRNNLEFWNGGINWVSSGEVSFCNILTTKEKITQKGLDNSSCKLHPPDTVILAMIGEGKTRGQAALLKTEAAHNQNSAAIRLSDIFIPQLLFYYFVYTYEKNRGIGSGNNQKALNKERVKNFDIPVCSVAEQSLIIAEIESRLSVCDKLEESIAQSLQQAEALRQSILKKAFEGKLVPQSPNDEPASVLLERIRAEREEVGSAVAKSATPARRKKKPCPKQ